MDSNSAQRSPEAKKPCKGILKTSSSFDKHSVSQRRKSTKFDELNVLQTYHPPDKDYGHMKIEEPKTPYNYENPDDQSVDELDAEDLAKRLQSAEQRRSISSVDSSEDEYPNETEEERKKRLEFEKRRKAHYNEFEAVKMARKLIEEEDDEDDEDDSKPTSTTKTTPSAEDAASSDGRSEDAGNAQHSANS